MQMLELATEAVLSGGGHWLQYDELASLLLARTRPQQALFSAANLRYFVRDVAVDGGKHTHHRYFGRMCGRAGKLWKLLKTRVRRTSPQETWVQHAAMHWLGFSPSGALGAAIEQYDQDCGRPERVAAVVGEVHRAIHVLQMKLRILHRKLAGHLHRHTEWIEWLQVLVYALL